VRARLADDERADRPGAEEGSVDHGSAGRGELGSAMIEFLVLGILTLVPLLYLVVAVFEVQRNLFAVTQAAREAGRAVATTPGGASPDVRGDYAARLAMADQGLDDAGLSVRYQAAGSGCGGGGASVPPALQAGESFVVCVSRVVTVPGIPGFFDARRNTVTGRFVVEVDDFRQAPPS